MTAAATAARKSPMGRLRGQAVTLGGSSCGATHGPPTSVGCCRIAGGCCHAGLLPRRSLLRRRWLLRRRRLLALPGGGPAGAPAGGTVCAASADQA